MVPARNGLPDNMQIYGRNSNNSGVFLSDSVLVAGEYQPRCPAPGVVTTGKAAKVFVLQDKGQDIEVMTEDDFLRSL